MNQQRLSALDTAFVYGESQRIPLHVGGLSIIEAGPLRQADGTIDIGRVRAEIASRLHLIPRFRQRLVEVPLDSARPVWVDDVRFNVDHHVHLTGLPRPGRRRQLLDLMARLQAGQMDRNRPLWEIWYVDGLDDDSVIGMITKIHHCMIDGTSGIELGTLLYDLTPERTHVEPVPWTPAPEPTPTELVMQAMKERALGTVEAARSVAETIRNPAKPIRHVTNFLRALGTLTSEIDKLPFNERVSSRRRFDTVSVELDKVLEARAALGVKVNDVVLGAVTAALREYCRNRGIKPESLKRIKALVPVDAREPGDTELGTKVSSIFVELPMAEKDPCKRVQVVARRTRELKESNMADGANMWSRVTSVLPPTLLRLTAYLQFRGLMSGSNVMVSSVRGPAVPFYSFGGQVIEFHPYFGVQDYLGLIIVIVSYAGRMQIGLTTDPDLMPDLKVFVDALPKAIDEIHRAAVMPAPVARKVSSAAVGKAAVKPRRKRRAARAGVTTRAESRKHERGKTRK